MNPASVRYRLGGVAVAIVALVATLLTPPAHAGPLDEIEVTVFGQTVDEAIASTPYVEGGEPVAYATDEHGVLQPLTAEPDLLDHLIDGGVPTSINVAHSKKYKVGRNVYDPLGYVRHHIHNCVYQTRYGVSGIRCDRHSMDRSASAGQPDDYDDFLCDARFRISARTGTSGSTRTYGANLGGCGTYVSLSNVGVPTWYPRGSRFCGSVAISNGSTGYTPCITIT